MVDTNGQTESTGEGVLAGTARSPSEQAREDITSSKTLQCARRYFISVTREFQNALFMPVVKEHTALSSPMETGAT